MAKNKKDWSQDPEWHADMIHAFDTAAELIDSEEFGGDESVVGRQEAAYHEVARRIRIMAQRYENRFRK